MESATKTIHAAFQNDRGKEAKVKRVMLAAREMTG
jgi:hypothetical protein